jgi:hypothetical protein
MPRVSLTTGDYTTRSVIGSAQRSVNIYSEKNPEGSASPSTFYPAPGLTLLGTPPNAGPARGIYMANDGSLYYVAGPYLYFVDSSWQFHSVGNIATTTGIVSMADNGTTLVLVDGSGTGYQVDLTSRAFSQISAGSNSPTTGSGAVYAFPGATRNDMIDGYMLFNQPDSRLFYSTYNNEITFDSLYTAAKNGYSDNLVTLIVTLRQIWLIGEKTTEIWFDAGGTDFPFQILAGPFIQHGCMAPYSVAQVNGRVFWLSEDQAGGNILVRGEGYKATAITTQAVSEEWSQYIDTTDANAFTFQQNGHIFYQINFPSADRSWRWDDTTGQWSEVPYVDSDGVEHRHRVAVAVNAYGINVGGDWANGNLYQLDPNSVTDHGQPMMWRRGMPHMMADGKRVKYSSFILDCDVGSVPGFPSDTPPYFLLRWSDTRGATWSEPVQQSLGATGQFYTTPTIRRLGYGRDRVFEVYGVIPGPQFALNGAFVEAMPLGS